MFVDFEGLDLESKEKEKSNKWFICRYTPKMVVRKVFDDDFVHSV
jgi:hypothetical protein